MAVVGREEQHLRVGAEGSDGRSLRIIDPIDVPLGDRVWRPRMVASYQSANPEWVLSLSEDRLPGEAMPTVVFDQLRLASLLGRAGEGQHQAIGQIRAVGIQGLRITLPEESELWSVALDGRPVEVRNETSAVFLAWPSSSTADEVHTLEITWMTAGNPFASMATVEQVPPAFEAVTGTGDVVHVELLQQTWDLMHPEEAMLVSNHGEFKPSHALEVSSLLSGLPRALTWPTGQEVTETLVALCLLLVVVGVFVMISRNSTSIADPSDRNSLRNLGWTAGVAALVIIIVVLMLPAVQSSREAARRTAATAEMHQTGLARRRDSMEIDGAEYYADDMYESYDAEMDEFGGGGFGGGMGGFDNRFSGAEFESGATTATSEPMSAPEAEMPLDAIAEIDRALSAADGESGQGDSAPGEGSPRGGGRGLPEEMNQPGTPFGVQPELNIVGRDEWPNRTIAGLAEPNSFNGDLDIPFRQGSFDLGTPPSGGYSESLAANGMPVAGTPIGSPGQPYPPRARGALLSLPISIVVPPRTTTTSFEYVGAQSDTSRTRLSVSYVDRELGQIITWAAAALILLWMWLLRAAPARTKVILALVAPAAVIALALVVPGTWHVVLDGLLIGSLAGLGLWTLVGIVKCCCSKCCAVKQPTNETSTGAPQATALLVLGLFGLGSGTHAAADDLLPPTRVIVPYESLEELEQEGVSRVIIPRDDFWRLWNAAHPELEDVPPPAAALVTRADFAASLVTDGPPRVSVTATFEILALSNDRQAGGSRPRVIDIPLPLGQVPINSSMLDDEPANVVLRDGRLILLLPREAMADGGGETAQRHQLTIEFDLPSPGAGSARGDFTLPLLSPSSGLVTFVLPRPSDELELLVGDGREAFELIETDDGEALRISSALKPSTRFSWQVREMRGNLESTVHADTGIAVVAGRQGLSVRHAFQVRVLQGTLSEISMTLPAAGRLQQIVGGDVVGWQYDQENAEPELTIFFRSGIEQSTSFSVDLFQPLSIDGATTVDVPLIALQGVSREAGVLAVYPQDDLTARSQGLQGLRQINIDQFTPVVAPTLPATAASQAFRFVGETERGCNWFCNLGHKSRLPTRSTACGSPIANCS